MDLPPAGTRAPRYNRSRRTQPLSHMVESTDLLSKTHDQIWRETPRLGGTDNPQPTDCLNVRDKRTQGVAPHATVDPTNQTNGMNENALAIFDSSASSPMPDFNTPTFPFNAPASALLPITLNSEWERPKLVMERTSPSSPIVSTGLRPIRSESRPHCKTNMASVRKKSDSCIIINPASKPGRQGQTTNPT